MALGFVSGLLLVSCGQSDDAPFDSDAEKIEVPSSPDGAINRETTDLEGEELAAVVRLDTSKSDPMPEELLGTWVFAREECDEDMLADMGEPTPVQRDIRAQITFDANRTYWMDVEGFPFSGSFRYEDGDHPRITLDNRLNFSVSDDTLQNWSEGDATYLCGRVFVRN